MEAKDKKESPYLKFIIVILILILALQIIFAYYFFKPEGVWEILQSVYFSSNIFS